MFANRYTALVDACSLVSTWRRNLLLTLAEAEFFRVRWSEEILNETERTLIRIFVDNSKDDPDGRAKQAVIGMQRAFPESCVEDYKSLIVSLDGIPDPDDRHVLAAAMRTQAQCIVTENLKHFPPSVLSELGLEARSADDFISDTITLDEGRAIVAIRSMRTRLRRPEFTPKAMLRSLEAHGLVETASVLQSHSGYL